MEKSINNIMPTYTFENTDTHEHLDVVLRISELDQYKADHPHLKQVILPATTISGRDRKPDDGFRDILRNVKKGSGRGNTIETF
jgi:hypothetical protein